MIKNFKIYLIIWLIAIIVINGVKFAGSIDSNILFDSSWTAYIIVMLAFIIQLICAYIAFKKDNSQKLFYNMSLMLISNISLIIAVIVGIFCIAVPQIPILVGTIACVAVTGVADIIILITCFAINTVSNIDDDIETKTFTIRTLTTDSEHLIAEAETSEMKLLCKKVYEALRYSDPVSNIALAEINEEIQREFSAFEVSVIDNDIEMAQFISTELLKILDRRNKKCKQLK